MKTILVFGAGKSATVLIDYLKNTVNENNWKLIVADADFEQARQKAGNQPNVNAVELNVHDTEERRMLIEEADIVISLLPPALHILIAKDCVAIGRHLLNASYVDESIKNLEAEIKSKELLFICELGLDPGIDHMSAMKLFDEIREKGGEITSFKSHCGGLVAPESDNNPWHYKISWNPRNVVLAGSAGAVYKANNKIVEKTYNQIFENCSSVFVDDLPALSWYPNRDSLSYIQVYDLQQAKTFIRTTLRYADFCKGWNLLVDFEFTNDKDDTEISACKTYKDWYQQKLKKKLGEETLDQYLQKHYSPDDQQMMIQQLKFLQIDNEELLPSTAKSSADLLQNRIEQKLILATGDKDMIVMLHEIEYELNSKTFSTNSSLVVKGEDAVHTAMAKTVGLPLAIAAKLILQKKINLKGLHIPVRKEIYEQVLAELKEHGIMFKEKFY